MHISTINFLGEDVNIESGLIKADSLYEKTDTAPNKRWLYLYKDGDIDIPLMLNDHIIIHGGEKIFAGDANTEIGENPTVRNPVCPKLNGKLLEVGVETAKVSGLELRKLDTDLDASKLFADLDGQVDAFIRDEWVLVVQENDRYLTIPIDDDDTIDLEKCARTGRKPPKGQENYKIRIDSEKYKVNTPVLTGREILGLVKKDYKEWTLNQKFHGGRRKPIEEEQKVDFSQPGIERFETVKKQAQQGIVV